MQTIRAKPVIDGKFWIVEEDDAKIGILKFNDQQKYVFSSKNITVTYDSKKKLFETFGKDFFEATTSEKIPMNVDNVVQGYPTSTTPHNAIFDVKRHLPLFTKSEKSKSMFCAGYYIIKFDKGWVRSFCPKLITLERNEFKGPFTTELEMKVHLTNASK